MKKHQLAYPYLQSFFTGSTLDTSDLELQHFWLQGKSVHFLDQDFHYKINKPKIIFYISLMDILALFLVVFTIGMLILGITKNPALIVAAAIVGGILMLIGVTIRLMIKLRKTRSHRYQ